MTQNFWNKKKVLITGHTGFKGSWLYFILKILGANVYGVSLKPAKKSLFNNLNIFRKNKSFYCDITEYKKLNKITKKINPQIIFHFAAQSLVGKSFSHFDETYKTNIIGTLNILKIIKENKNIKTCLITTTDKVYENVEKKKKMYLEYENLKGNNPYSGSKVAKEHLIFSFVKSFLKKKNIVVVRSGNVIGGGDWNNSRLIPDMVSSFQKRKKFIVRNLNHTRPWQHIYDVLEVYMKIIKKIHRKKSFFDHFNVAFHNKNQKPVREIIRIFKKDNLFKNIKISKIKIKQYKEDKFLNISNSKIKKFVNIKSKFNKIDDCIINVINWYKVYLLDMKSIQDYSKKEIIFFLKNKY